MSDVTLALLAAGDSRRFGDEDKLTAKLHGKMLGLHAAEILSEISFDHRVVITSHADHLCAEHWTALGFEVIINDRASEGQSTSVRLAAQQAIDGGTAGLCICLADMPFMTGDHIQNLLTAFSGKQQAVASTHNGTPMPPAIFPANELVKLEALQGDRGARTLLTDAQLIHVNGHMLTDIDTIEQLQQFNDQTSPLRR